MECNVCMINAHNCNHHVSSCNENYSCGNNQTHSGPAADYEPVAPTLSLGKRILWLTETRAASGIVKWIGRIPLISPGWSAGIEFDNPVPNGGDGDFRGRLYFPSRRGHALFLPISELITVDDSSPCNLVSREPAATPSRFPDSCSNYFYQRQRDSTYGHYRPNFCSSCERNDYQHNSPCCSHAPVYDRITSRRSLHYDDHPYETFNNGLPFDSVADQRRARHQYNNSIQNGLMHDRITRVSDGCSRHSTLREYEGSQSNCQQCEDVFSDVRISNKDSFFNSRSSSFRLISGIKEWVSCWVLGVTKQRRNSNIFIKGRKTIASLIVSRGSPSLTGQRLSSFSDYATFKEFSSIKKNLRPAPKYSSNQDSDTDVQPSPKSHSRRRKRQAPLPPVQHDNLILQRNNFSNSSATSDYNRAIHSFTNNHFNDITQDRSHVNNHSGSIRRSRKKRPAPLPPHFINDKYHATSGKENFKTNSMSRFEKDSLPEKSHYGSMNSTLNQLHQMNRKEKLKHAQNVLAKINREELSLSNPRLSKSSRKTFCSTKNDAYLDSLTESDSENYQDSRLKPVSFSGGESDDDEKFGLVKYGRVQQGNIDSGNTRVTSENSVHYNNENDVCLKISIKKLETNVVTVEDINGSRVSQFTIEDESSISELSDEDAARNEAKSGPSIEIKETSSESSLVTTDEVPEKTKTIFEDLKLKPPVKKSVKDFVQAFNMLAITGDKGGKEKLGKLPQNKTAVKETKSVSSASKSSVASALYAIQSFPTKWEYQNNQATNVIYPTNQFLMPIAEESHNDTSEHDKNSSNEDLSTLPKATGSSSKSKSCKYHHSIGKNSSSKPCTHCFEPHKDISSKHLSNHKSKSIVHSNKNIVENANSKKIGSSHSTQASAAALASLLPEKANLRTSKVGETSGKSNTKPDVPIMVSLYIEDKSSHRGPIPLLVTPSMSLKKLKKQVEKEYLFPKDQQCWILGESFAVRDDASLSSYGVTDTGCPVLLYVMGKDSKCKSLPARHLPHSNHQPSKFDDSSSESEIEILKKSRSKLGNLPLAKEEENRKHFQQKVIAKAGRKSPSKKSLHRRDEQKITQKTKADYHADWETDYQKKQDYRTLVQLDDLDLVANNDLFECPVCFMDIGVGEGAILQECLHTFCRECLAGVIQFSDTAVIKCPFRNDEYSCESHLQEREIKSLVLPDVYEKHLQRSMALAESQADDSFHCKTPDCQGWCLYEDNVNTFLCPVCKHTNCLTCAAIHEGKNCKQFQDDVAFLCDSSEEAKKTKEYLENMVKDGEAMECPKCQVILMKKWGCDWLKCSMCHTEVCWVTKGPRWGPAGKGDTTGGCKCMVNGVRCHPKCSYCH